MKHSLEVRNFGRLPSGSSEHYRAIESEAANHTTNAMS